MNKNQQKNRMGAVIILLAAACLNGYAQQDSTKVSSDSKEEGNRNVMLNAASANGPREISIGLPGGDVNVLENGLPVVYNSNPHNVNTHWRGDSSLGHTGLLKISETAITTGNIGYAVNSFTELGLDKEKKMNGVLNYGTNHFGKQQFDFNLNGSIGKDWFYSGSIYQNFDPGSFKLRFAQYQDRTQIYKFALTKFYNEGRGQLSAIYHLHHQPLVVQCYHRCTIYLCRRWECEGNSRFRTGDFFLSAQCIGYGLYGHAYRRDEKDQSV